MNTNFELLISTLVTSARISEKYAATELVIQMFGEESAKEFKRRLREEHKELETAYEKRTEDE